MTMRARRTTYRLGEAIPLDVNDAAPEMGDANAKGRLRVLVRRGTRRWGSSLDRYNTVANLKRIGSFTANELGYHTVVLVYFDRGADNNWRFHRLMTEEVLVIP
jgi:hypothetical protein